MIFQWFSRNSNDFSMIYQTFSTSKLQNPSRALRIQWIFNDFQWIGHVYIPFALPTILQNGHSSAGCQLMTSWSLKQCVSICIKANGAQGLTVDARTWFVFKSNDKVIESAIATRGFQRTLPYVDPAPTGPWGKRLPMNTQHYTRRAAGNTYATTRGPFGAEILMIWLMKYI